MKLIGRKKEIQELEKAYRSGQFEFIALYGRRRVGKTYLVSQVFEDRISFRHAASPNDEERQDEKGLLKMQLEVFYGSLLAQGLKESKKPNSWVEAFLLLIRLFEGKDPAERWVIFLDEFPWMDTKRSNFIEAFSWFLNFWAANQKNLMIIAAGSSTSWMLNNLIHSTGGLYNRVTNPIRLSPFRLQETEQFFREKGFDLSRYSIARIQMAFGGIPYYLNFLDRGEGLSRFVDRMLFEKGAKLGLEYDTLFRSSFEKGDLARKIAEYLGKRSSGYTRKEIVEGLKISDGKAVKDALDALQEGDFVLEYVPYKEAQNKKRYRLIDPFCIFYLHFVAGKRSLDPSFFADSVEPNSWIGAAFENLCAAHLEQIKRALVISKLSSIEFSLVFPKEEDKKGAQVDLVLVRKDRIVNLCEMKFYGKPYVQTEKEHHSLTNRVARLKETLPATYSIAPVLITVFEPSSGGYPDDYVQVLTLDDLFM